MVSKEVLQQQGATTLSQALRNTPGVTFLLGENGNTATGDSIFMRGFDTQGSIFIDGIRDLGTVTRDIFNTEQVEIAKGPAGPDYGRSAASGYVNLASKVPAAEKLLGRHGQLRHAPAMRRITGDINHASKARGTALRLNVMGQDGDVDGRDFIERKGWAVAPSLAFGLEGDTRAYFYLLHTEQDNMPDGGVPTHRPRGLLQPGLRYRRRERAASIPTRVDRENFYGFASDFEEIKGTMFTARFEHDFSDNVSIRNTSRYGRLHQFYVLTGVNALTVTDPNPDNVDRGAHAPGASSRRTRCSRTRPTSPRISRPAPCSTPSRAASSSSTRSSTTPPTLGLGTPITPANLYNPNRNDVQPGYAPVRDGAYTRGETQTAGVYVFDTLSVRRALASDRRLPRRQLRDGFRQRGLLDRSSRIRRCPWARSCRRRLSGRRHAVLVQGRRAVQAGRERQHLSVACDFAAAAGRRELHVLQQREQHQQSEPRPHRGQQPRARHEVGIPRRRAGRDRRRLSTARTRTS